MPIAPISGFASVMGNSHYIDDIGIHTVDQAKRESGQKIAPSSCQVAGASLAIVVCGQQQ